MTPDLLRHWDAEIAAELRQLEDQRPEAERAILVAEEAAAAARDALSAVHPLRVNGVPLANALGQRLGLLERTIQSSDSAVVLARAQLDNLQRLINDRAAALAQLDAAREAAAPAEVVEIAAVVKLPAPRSPRPAQRAAVQ